MNLKRLLLILASTTLMLTFQNCSETPGNGMDAAQGGDTNEGAKHILAKDLGLEEVSYSVSGLIESSSCPDQDVSADTYCASIYQDHPTTHTYTLTFKAGQHLEIAAVCNSGSAKFELRAGNNEILVSVRDLVVSAACSPDIEEQTILKRLAHAQRFIFESSGDIIVLTDQSSALRLHRVP